MRSDLWNLSKSRRISSKSGVMGVGQKCKPIFRILSLVSLSCLSDRLMTLSRVPISILASSISTENQFLVSISYLIAC